MARLLAVALAVLLGTACAPRVRTKLTFSGTGSITLANGDRIQVKSPGTVTSDHSQYSDGSGPDYDVIRIESGGRVWNLSTQGVPPRRLLCNGALHTAPTGRIFSLEFDAKGDLTVGAIVDPLLAPAPSPSPTK